MRRFWIVFGLLSAGALAATSTAQANGRAANSTGITMQPGNPNNLMVGATFGLLLSQDAGANWYWVCETILGGPTGADNGLAWLPNNTLVSLNPEGLFTSTDNGCTWAANSAFTNVEPADITLHPIQSATWYVVANTEAGGALFRTTDNGATFNTIYTATGVTPPLFTSVRVAASNPNRIYVGAFLSSGGIVIERSNDAGSSWSSLPFPTTLNPNNGVTPTLGVSPTNPDILLVAVFDPQANQAVIFRSTDGGQTMTKVATPMEPFREFTYSTDGQTVWAAGIAHLFRSTDAGATFTALTQPNGNACAFNAGKTLYACGSAFTDRFALATSTDSGTTWKPIFNLAQIHGPLACPATTPENSTCSGAWAQQAASLTSYTTAPAVTPANPNNPTTATPAAKSGCHCAGGSVGVLDGVVGLVAASAAWCVRRRRID